MRVEHPSGGFAKHLHHLVDTLAGLAQHCRKHRTFGLEIMGQRTLEIERRRRLHSRFFRFGSHDLLR
ncbi:hypothetical protein SDC9_188538 [bioreactor metagenome]|uniref:Uncharacterized protein n=1 Tax=bioreactor metagenome TaxID=1076179 RepID=A0A645HPM7_9ZZZZ